MKAYSPSSVTLLKSGATSGISDNLLDALSTAACAEEDGTRPIGRSIDLLREADLLSDDCLKNPEMIARSLMRVASVNLSVGRLLEGHINAFLLINLYGSAQMKSRVRHQIDTGAFLGVWGADGQVPVTSDAACTRLTGMKNFASGIGTVTHAVVTVNSGPQVSMALSPFLLEGSGALPHCKLGPLSGSLIVRRLNYVAWDACKPSSRKRA
jgi:hypothetical protein